MNSIARATRSLVARVTLLCLLAPGLSAQVRSVTLGITTHCPYGVGGCWAEIRNGLNLPDAIESLAKTPDTDAQTCTLRIRDTWIPDPTLFARHFTNMHVGVDVRGVEGEIDGVLELKGRELVLRVNGSGTLARLAPLTQKVQWDVKRKRPEKPTFSERRAFENLLAQFKRRPGPVRVIGPMTRHPSTQSGEPAWLKIEVRKFQALKRDA